MKLQFTEAFRACYRRLPKEIQRRVDKTLLLLKENPRHPSLHTKRMKGTHGIWEARVTLAYRITFAWLEDTAILRRVGTHDILNRETR